MEVTSRDDQRSFMEGLVKANRDLSLQYTAVFIRTVWA